MAKRGRPTKYKPEYVEQAGKLAAMAATDIQIADFFGVCIATIYEWQQVHPEFSEALKLNKQKADEYVENSLYWRARGYSHKAVKIFADPKTGRQKLVEYTEQYPPDTTACIFWLKNRKREEWRDRVDVDAKTASTILIEGPLAKT